MKRIHKYETLEVIPEGAIYLNTVTQEKEYNEYVNCDQGGFIDCWKVWHYFLVDVEEN